MVTEPYPSRVSAISDNPPLLRISLLGKPALFLGGRLHPFRQPKKAFAILAYLLLHRDRVVSRASLGDLFWPDDDEETARANVRRYLYRVMAALPPTFNGRPWLRTDKLTVRWNSEAPAWLDVAELERASAGGSELETAVALYRGDFLEDFHDDWVLAQRERLRQLHISNLTRLADARLRVFDYPGAIEALQMLLRSDPWHEDAARRLMTLRVETGDRSGALAEYEALAKRLRAELNTDPMPETMAVYEAIRRNQPLARAAIAADSGKREQQKALPFVGRDRPVAALRRSWERAAIGSGCAVIVSGEAGIGKSRLIHELLVSAESQGARIAFGTVARIESEPYQAVVEALRGVLPLVAVGNMEPAAAAALATLVPELHERAPALAPVAELPPDRNRQRLFDAVAQAFEQFARARPAILILEDLHWASASTIELVEFLVRRLTAHPILVVASFRDDEPRRHEGFYRLLRAVAPERSTHLSLRGLEPEDLLTLVARIAPDAADHEARARKLYQRSDGNPLFVTELLAHQGEESPDAVPTGISGMVLGRLERCSARARRLLENAAAIGDGFAVDVLREASAWPFADVLDALDEALDAALVRAWRRGDFAFSHQLVHAAIYEATPADVRKRLHRRVARALETYYAGRAGDFAAAIARQYDAAEMYAEAGTCYLDAARRALSVFAQDDAIALASRGLALVSDESARFALLCARETAYARLGAREEQRDDCAALRETASALGDPACEFEAQRRTCALCLQSGNRQAESAAIEELRALAQRSQEPAWFIEALMAQARFEANRGRMAAAHELLYEREADVQCLEPALAVEFMFLLAHVETRLGRYADVERAIALARAQASTARDPLLEGRALRAALSLAQTRHDVATMERLATEMLRVYRSVGDAEGMAAALQDLAATKSNRFAIEEERNDIQSALELFERIQKPVSIAAILINRGALATHLGLLEDAEQDYLSAREIARAVGSPALVSLATQNLSCVALLRGNATEAEILAQQGLEESRDVDEVYVKVAAHEVLGTAQRELDRFEAAIENIEAALALRGSDQIGTASFLEAQSELLPAYVAKGRLEDALRIADQVVHALKANCDCFSLPTIALQHAAETYAAAGKKRRSSEVFAFAVAVLADRAARLPDDRTREAYLALPAHQRLSRRAQTRKAK